MTQHTHANGLWPGTWLVNCDVCGINISSDQIRKRWDGLLVCKKDWEEDHPQKYIRVGPDPIAVPIKRPESVNGIGDVFIPQCNLFGGQAVAGAAVAGCSVSGTWRLQSQGGSLLTPPPPAPGLEYVCANLIYLFRNTGPDNNTLTNFSPYGGLYTNSGTDTFSNQTIGDDGPFGSHITFNPSGTNDQSNWKYSSGGVPFTGVTINAARWTSSFWVKGDLSTPGITQQVIYRVNHPAFQNLIEAGCSSSVSPRFNNLNISQALYLTAPSVFVNDGTSNVVTGGLWVRLWFVNDNNTLSIYLNNTLLTQQTRTVSSPGNQFFPITDTNAYRPFSRDNFGGAPGYPLQVADAFFINNEAHYPDELPLDQRLPLPTGGAGNACSDDPNYASLIYLNNYQGTNGSTTFTDASPIARPIVRNGNAQISTGAQIFGTSSAAFDGTGDYLQLSTISGQPLRVEFTETWSMGMWFRPLDSTASNPSFQNTRLQVNSGSNEYIQQHLYYSPALASRSIFGYTDNNASFPGNVGITPMTAGNWYYLFMRNTPGSDLFEWWLAEAGASSLTLQNTSTKRGLRLDQFGCYGNLPPNNEFLGNIGPTRVYRGYADSPTMPTGLFPGAFE